MDTDHLRLAYADLLDAVTSIVEQGEVAALDGGWDAVHILAHIAILDARTIAIAATICAASHMAYDNRLSHDPWTIERTIATAGGLPGLRQRVRLQGEILETLAGQVLTAVELDAPIPTLLLAGGLLQVEGVLSVRVIIDGLATDHLPGHARQLRALLPTGA